MLIRDIEIEPKEKREYELKLWVDKTTSIEEQGKIFKGKVVVSAVQVNAPPLDVTAPVVILAGSTSINIPQGSSYVDLGVESVRDNKDILDKSDVVVSYEYYDGSTTKEVESVDTSKLGVYYAYYKISDSSKNEGAAVRIINVYKKDTIPPVITLNGSSLQEIDVEGEYTELGATATDDVEGDITNRVVTVGVVNTKREGIYYIKYLITDQEGNTASVVRRVIVGEMVIEINLDIVKKPTDKIPEIGENVSYKVEDESIATVDPEGNVTAKDVGETKVIITKEDGSTKEVIVKVEKTITPTYNTEGPGVIRVENTEGECAIRIKGGTCPVKAPDILVEEGYTVVGWNSDPTAKDGTLPGNNLEIGEGKTYYPITYKNEQTLRIDYSKGSGVSSIGSSSDSCTTNRVYRGESERQSCNVVLPSITPLGGYGTGFWSLDRNASSGMSIGTSIELTSNTTYYAKALDTTRPYWKVVGVSPSGTVSPGTQVVITIQGLDTSGSVTSTLAVGNITVQVGGVTVTPTVKTLSAASNVTNGKQYTLTLGGITAQGALSISIAANTLRDGSGNTNVSLALTPGVSFIKSAADTIFNTTNLGSNGGIDTSNSEQTFITGTNPNNYIWYSGKMWRAVSKYKSDNSIKLVTQWPISFLSYHKVIGYNKFKGSFAEQWLNDTSVDGFLGNLKNYTSFIKTGVSWKTLEDSDSIRNPKVVNVTDTIGLLNLEEVETIRGYLDNGHIWWIASSYDYSNGVGKTWRFNANSANTQMYYPSAIDGMRPAIILKPGIGIAVGTGTEKDPYRLVGDNDTPASGTLLKTRYSGEYVRFGNGNNNLYRIVSKENGNAKIVSAEPLKDSTGEFIYKKFGNSSSNTTYAPTDSASNIAYWLNNDFLNISNGYLTSAQVAMIDNGTWYLGAVTQGEALEGADKSEWYPGNSYRRSKYTTDTGTTLTSSKIEAKVGLLRYGEQLTGQIYNGLDTSLVSAYWTLTPSIPADCSWCNPDGIYAMAKNTAYSYEANDGSGGSRGTAIGIRPAMHLKSTVKITGGRGTKEEPFTISN